MAPSETVRYVKRPDPVAPIPVAGEPDGDCRGQSEYGLLQWILEQQRQLYLQWSTRDDVRGRRCELNLLECSKWESDPLDRNALAATDVDSERWGPELARCGKP
jgi:hypothetical protein